MLKKLAAILLVFLVFFNFLGYRILIDYFQQQQETSFTYNVEKNNFPDQSLIYIKMPVNLPYYSNSPDYEKVKGSVDINGIQYNFVKRRIFNDSIELVCLPDYSGKDFQTARVDYVKNFSDWQGTHSGKNRTAALKNISFEYFENFINFSLPSICEVKGHLYSGSSGIPPLSFRSVHEQPPEFNV